MMDHKKWLELPDENVIYHYGLVGSFTKFLVENFGKEKFKELYQNTNRNKTKNENIDVFNEIYNFSSLEDVEKSWREKYFIIKIDRYLIFIHTEDNITC